MKAQIYHNDHIYRKLSPASEHSPSTPNCYLPIPYFPTVMSTDIRV